MALLSTCIKYLESNLELYSALYDKDELDRAQSTLRYLKELESIREFKRR